MKKIYKILLIIFGIILFLFIILFLLFIKPSKTTIDLWLNPDYWTDKTAPPLFVCKKDIDCIPLPSECHPTSCINKDFENQFQKPEACTTIFMDEAAYTPEDCLCVNNICLNKNLNRN